MSSGDTLLVLALLLTVLVSLGGAWYALGREESGDLEYLLSYWWGGLLGMFAYRSYKETADPEAVRQCSNCGSAFADPPAFCPECGQELGEHEESRTADLIQSGARLFCGHCKTELPEDASRCPACDRVLTSAIAEHETAEAVTASKIQSGSRVFCRHCTTRVEADASRCPGCGRRFD